MTILDACVQVLQSAKRPMKAEEIFEGIKSGGLYEFRAKEPLSIVRGTLRKHLRSSGPHRVKELERGVYETV